MKVYIYQPSRNVMQSGRSKTKSWVLEYELETARNPEGLMGWTCSDDTLNQVQMTFDDLDTAKDFASKKGWDYVVSEPKKRRVVPKSYADNFK